MTDTSFLALAVRLVLSLGVVLVIMLAAAAVVKRKGMKLGGRRGGSMQVVARQTLGRNASLAVVRVGERHLILGVSEQSVTLIDEADSREFAPEGQQVTNEDHGTVLTDGEPSPRNSAWTAVMESLRERTVRRS